MIWLLFIKVLTAVLCCLECLHPSTQHCLVMRPVQSVRWQDRRLYLCHNLCRRSRVAVVCGQCMWRATWTRRSTTSRQWLYMTGRHTVRCVHLLSRNTRWQWPRHTCPVRPWNRSVDCQRRCCDVRAFAMRKIPLQQTINSSLVISVNVGTPGDDG